MILVNFFIHSSEPNRDDPQPNMDILCARRSVKKGCDGFLKTWVENSWSEQKRTNNHSNSYQRNLLHPLFHTVCYIHLQATPIQHSAPPHFVCRLYLCYCCFTCCNCLSLFGFHRNNHDEIDAYFIIDIYQLIIVYLVTVQVEVLDDTIISGGALDIVHCLVSVDRTVNKVDFLLCWFAVKHCYGNVVNEIECILVWNMYSLSPDVFAILYFCVVFLCWFL